MEWGVVEEKEKGKEGKMGLVCKMNQINKKRRKRIGPMSTSGLSSETLPGPHLC